MSDPRKKSYRIVGGDLDGEIYDEVAEEDAEALREAAKATRLEEVTPTAPIDQPRVPDAGAPSEPKRKQPRGEVSIGTPEVIKREPVYDMVFGEDEALQVPRSDEGPRGIMVTGEPEVIKPGHPDYDAVFDQDEANPPPPAPTRRPNYYPPEAGAPPEAYNFFEGAERALAPLDNPLREQIAELGGYGEAAMRGFNETGYYGGSDEAAAGIRALGGEDLDTALAQERAANEYYAQGYPWTTAVSRGAGLVPGMLIGRPLAAATQAVKGLGPNALRIAKNLVRPTAEGAVAGGLSSDSDSVQQTLEDAGWGSLWGLGAGILGETLSEVGPWLRDKGVSLRRRSAAPGTQQDMNVLSKQRGIDYMEHGIDETFDELGLADNWTPQSAADVAKRIGEDVPSQAIGAAPDPSMLTQTANQIGNAVDTAQAIGARGNWKNPADELSRQARQRVSGVQPGRNEFADAQALLRVRNEIPGSPLAPAPPALPRELQAKKLAFQEHGKYPEGVGPVAKEVTREADAYRAGRGAVANELDQTIQQAGPEVHGQFVRGNQDFLDLKQFGDMARDEAARVAAQKTLQNVGRYGAGVPGVAAGAMLSDQLGLGMAPGAVAGGVLGGIVGDAAGAATQKYGKDILGIAGVKGGEMLSGLGPVIGATAGRLEPETALDTPNVAQAALIAIKRDPGAMGKWSSDFAEAMNAPEPLSAMNTLILRLVQSDPEFRQYVLPNIRASAVEQR